VTISNVSRWPLHCCVGSGKTNVGRELSKLLGLPFLDVDDDHLEPYWGTTVAAKLQALGDEGFIAAEGDALCQLNKTHTIISLSGSNPLHARSMEHIAKNGLIVYLDIDPADIIARCHRMKTDRIVGQATKSLESILAWRRSIYENSYDLRCAISKGETPAQIAARIKALIEWKRGHQAYISTRDVRHSARPSGTPARSNSITAKEAEANGEELDFLDVVAAGLAPDRGLFVPASLHHLKLTSGEWQRLASEQLSYPELALRIMERFPLGEKMHPSRLRELLYEAYASFNTPDVLPLVPMQLQRSGTHYSASSSVVSDGFHQNMWMMQTFHGPTASFKDLSLQLLPKLLKEAMDSKESHTETKSNIITSAAPHKETVGLLVATSGDTGTAALDGFARVPGTPVIVLYPAEGVSVVQRAQMQTTAGDVLVLGLRNSDFDFCQKIVKDIFNDVQLKKEFRKIVPNLTLSSANSMNWGRFLPQIVFSISSYLRLVQNTTVKLGDPVDLVVPTGNFGNILGALYAKIVLGLPLGRIVCASNANNILYDALTQGVYDLRNRKFHQTVSPSIDILVSSNLERFLYLLAGEEHEEKEQVKNLFEQLATAGHFRIPDRLLARVKSHVEAGWTTEEQCLATIKQTFARTGMLIDPHTAVAVHVANNMLAGESNREHRPVVVASTAHYAKFPNAMLRAFEIRKHKK
jgi:threonine synthase